MGSKWVKNGPKMATVNDPKTWNFDPSELKKMW